MVAAVASDDPEMAENTPLAVTAAMAMPPRHAPKMVRDISKSSPAMRALEANTPMKMNKGMALKLKLDSTSMGAVSSRASAGSQPTSQAKPPRPTTGMASAMGQRTASNSKRIRIPTTPTISGDMKFPLDDALKANEKGP